VFLAAGLGGVLWYRGAGSGHDAGPRLRDVGSLFVLGKLAWFFFVTGAFTFGGGLAVVPLLEKGLVEQGEWLTAADFLMAIAVGMVTPGPVMTAATFAGYIVAGPVGAFVCTIAIYLPSFLLVLAVAPVLMRHRANPRLQGFVKGVYGAAIGAILGATVTLGARAIEDWTTALIAVGGMVVLQHSRVGGPLLVGVAAAVGLLTFQFRVAGPGP